MTFSCNISRSLIQSAAASALRGPLLAAMIILTVRLAPAQEALRNSLTTQTAIESRQLPTESLPYTLKSGDLRVLVIPSLGLEWNDNVRLSKNAAQDDFILRPLLNLSASYPVTQRNLLQLNVTFGYEKYFNHDDLSGWYLASGSQLSFDVLVKDFRFNFHDRFQYVQDSAGEAAVANTGSYGQFQNTAGVLGTWDLRDVTLSLGYDHLNELSTSSQFSYTDRATEMVVARAGLRLNPQLTTGVEGTAAFTTYDQRVLNDNTGYSGGVYADWRPGSYFQIQPRAGYAVYQFQDTSQLVRTSDINSWYVNLLIHHQVTDAISYSIDAGREIRLGIQSDAIEDWYVRPSISWNLIKDLSLQTFFSYEYGKQGRGNVMGNLTENYDWVGTGLSASYPIMKRLTLGLSYRLTLRTSDAASRDYAQNVIGVQLSYRQP